MKKNVLIVGGAGFIGSHVTKLLQKAGYHTVVFDNLSSGLRPAVPHGTFFQGDIGHLDDLETLFTTYTFDAVMHFAGFIDVGESVIDPLCYYRNNVAYTLNLLEAMQSHGVKNIVFSSSAAIFGIPAQTHISEDHPKNPINAYGESKWMVEKMLADFSRAYGLRFCALRYFNAAGADPEGELPIKKNKEINLIPRILSSIQLGKQGSITIFGTDYPTPDGTCIRDYIHVNDLAEAHILAMKQLLNGASNLYYNLGNGCGFSIRQVIDAVEKVTGESLNIIEGARRAGDPPVLIAKSTKAIQELNWSPKIPLLEEMVSHAWNAMQKEILEPVFTS